jgi:nicotinate-nucleotide pyrophosphorylase (carboxylating)
LNLKDKEMNLEDEILSLIDRAIHEDIGHGDVTTLACISNDDFLQGKVVIKQAGIVAALPFLEIFFKKIHPAVEVELLVPEGSYQKAGTVIATLHGPARGILSGQRAALNLIQHASGIATLTAAYVKKVAGTGCAIMDTRKTLPGLRCLEKYAVRVGGGLIHRYGLSDRFIIKNDHIRILAEKFSNPIKTAVRMAKEYQPNIPIEIEIDDYEKLNEALDTEALVIILCNMPPDEAVQCLEKICLHNKKAYIDSSGTITLDTIRAYAELGIEAILIGDLTHSVRDLDITLKCQTYSKKEHEHVINT